MTGPLVIDFDLPGRLIEFRTLTLPIRSPDSVANLYLALSGIIKWDIADWPTDGGWNPLLGTLNIDAPLEVDDLLQGSSATFFAAAIIRAENPILVSDTWGIEQGGPEPLSIKDRQVVIHFTSQTYGNAAIPALSFWIDLLLFRPSLVTRPPGKKMHIEGPVWDQRTSSARVNLRPSGG
jgi:hypothetical protein